MSHDHVPPLIEANETLNIVLVNGRKLFEPKSYIVVIINLLEELVEFRVWYCQTRPFERRLKFVLVKFSVVVFVYGQK